MANSSFFKDGGADSGTFASLDSKLAAAEASKVAAEAAKVAAEQAETDAQTAEANALSHANTAFQHQQSSSAHVTQTANNATGAQQSATAAQSSEDDARKLAVEPEDSQYVLSNGTIGYSALHYKEKASDSAAAASASASTASGHVTTASGHAATASGHAATASGHASTATTKAGEASASAAAALQSEQNAAQSETNSAQSANTASGHEANASTSENNSANSAQAAGSSASAASTSAAAASGHATNASNSATASANSATASSNSAGSAAAAQTAAEAARDSALSALDSFDDRYLGVKSSDPSLDNDGNALVSGALYFSSTTTSMKVYDGSNWLNAYASLSGALIANNNLSDLNNAGTARTNLGLAAVAASGAYSDLTGAPNLSSYITNNVSGDFTVDSGTLFVDAATNRVGINLGSGVSPTVPLNVAGTVRFQSTSSAGQSVELTNYSGVSKFYRANGRLEFQAGNTSSGVLELSNTGNLSWNGSVAQFNNINIPDNYAARFGNSQDLQIYHNGTDSFIDETASGWLYIRANDLVLGKYTGETYVKGIADGAVELYHDNAKKIETTSTGASVTGQMDVDSVLISTQSSDPRNFTGGTSGVKLGGDQPEFAVGTMYINRSATADGDIISFRKEASTIGSIETHGGKLQIGQGNANVQFSNASDAIIPSNGSGTVNDNALDLGTSSARFNDIHYGGVLNANASDYQIKVTSGSNQPWYLRSKSDGTFGVHLNGTGDIATFSSVGAASKGLNLDGGTNHNTHDATLHVTAADNSDWGIKVSADSGKTDYGLTLRMPNSFNNAFTVYKNATQHVNIDSTGIIVGSGSDYVWHAGNDGAGSGLDADLLDGYDSAENGSSKILRSASNGYLQLQNWVNIGGSGIYSSTTNGAHFSVNTATSYATWRTDGSRGGYDGIMFDDGGQQSIMFDSNRNGGIYAQNGGRWVIYHDYGNNCLGVGASTTSSSYELYVSGDIYATGNITAYSDARAKENVETIDGALGIVEQMRGVYYNKIDNPDKTREMGFLAQEVNAVEGASELVTYAEDIDQYSVSYGNTAALLVEAVKELSAEVKTLKAEIEELKKG